MPSRKRGIRVARTFSGANNDLCRQALPAVLERIDADLDKSLDRLFDLVRIPSISTDSAYKDFCRAAADHVAKDLDEPRLRADGAPDRGPSGGDRQEQRRDRANGGPRVLFYGHYDVQPVDPLDLWKSPPFEPRIDKLPDGRKIIVGARRLRRQGPVDDLRRGAARLEGGHRQLPIDITMMIEGEEECGSKSLFDFVRSNAAEFKRDLALVCDTGMWSPTTPLITTSLRGLLYEEVKVTCADRDLHSGLFGGAAANPIRVLARIIAALHDENGRVTIPGFYDGVKELPDDIKADLKALNLTAEEFLGQVGLKVPAGEKDRMLIEQIPRGRPATSTASSAAIPARAPRP